jgi:Tfp pilus assembly protein PilE
MAIPSFNYDDWQDKIFAYINKKMSDSDRQAFEVQMNENAELREAVTFDMILNEEAEIHFLAEYAQANWSHELTDASSDNKNEGENTSESTPNQAITPKSVTTYPLSIKAILGILAVVVILGFGYFIYKSRLNQAKITELERIEQTLFPHIVIDATTAKDTAISLYNSKQFEAAERFFIQQDMTNKNENGAYGLSRALNALFLDDKSKTDLALKILKPRYEAGDTKFEYEIIEWYLVKAYLQKGDYEAAKEIVKKIAKKIDTKTKYVSDAREILSVLEK